VVFCVPTASATAAVGGIRRSLGRQRVTARGGKPPFVKGKHHPLESATFLRGGRPHEPEHVLIVVPALGPEVGLGQPYFVCFCGNPGTRGERNSVTRLVGIVEITVTLFME
jgi:hypothetical protein